MTMTATIGEIKELLIEGDVGDIHVLTPIPLKDINSIALKIVSMRPDADAEILHYTLIVDQRVNLVKDMNFDKALERFVPEDKRALVRFEYNEWHKKAQ